MNSSQNGTFISEYSVTSISDLGFWVLVDDKEYFVPFKEYPGFKSASVNQILNFTFIAPNQLCWEDLDIDIELTALSHPESFPLIFR
jgi:hypothetical protein